MKIEIWSDFLCPSCYIGKRKLEKALKKFPHDKSFLIEYKSFELSPDANQSSEASIFEILAKQYNLTIEEAEISAATIIEQATAIGLEYNLSGMKLANTFDAHRLVQYATARGKGSEMTERLLKACFVEAKNIGEHGTLTYLAGEVGLDVEEVKDLLVSRKYTKDVRLDEEEAIEIGVKEIPFFVINEEYAISGVQSTEVFLEVLEYVWKEENDKENHQASRRKESGATYCCEGEDCYDEGVKLKST